MIIQDNTTMHDKGNVLTILWLRDNKGKYNLNALWLTMLSLTEKDVQEYFRTSYNVNNLNSEERQICRLSRNMLQSKALEFESAYNTLCNNVFHRTFTLD